MVQIVPRHHPSFSHAKGNQGKEEAGSTFVSPAITSMCTYNVGGCQNMIAYFTGDHFALPIIKRGEENE
jgi:hypothetical protein